MNNEQQVQRVERRLLLIMEAAGIHLGDRNTTGQIKKTRVTRHQGCNSLSSEATEDATADGVIGTESRLDTLATVAAFPDKFQKKQLTPEEAAMELFTMHTGDRDAVVAALTLAKLSSVDFPKLTKHVVLVSEGLFFTLTTEDRETDWTRKWYQPGSFYRCLQKEISKAREEEIAENSSEDNVSFDWSAVPELPLTTTRAQMAYKPTFKGRNKKSRIPTQPRKKRAAKTRANKRARDSDLFADDFHPPKNQK
jgi:hypothetical protein